jgi:hypothetical protein
MAPLLVVAALLLGSGALYWLLLAGAGPAPIENVAKTLNQVGATGEMNGSLQRLISLSLFGLPLVLPLVWLVWLYNGIVDKEEQVYATWAQVESNYQRRSDLLPNLVRTVARYLEHEHDTSIDVAARRTSSGRSCAAIRAVPSPSGASWWPATSSDRGSRSPSPRPSGGG